MNDSTPSGLHSAGWQTCDPAEAGMDAAKLAAAVAFAKANETKATQDLAAGLASVLSASEPAPWNDMLGPTKPRGGPNGLILRHGRVVAAWGDTQRVDMTFSVTKSYLGVLAGIAVSQGRIGDVDDPVRDTALNEHFDAPQNRDITWRHLLHQSSEWEGTLWSKPDLVDRNRQVGVGADNTKKGTPRDLQKPGTFFEYNDVRVNLLALTLLHVFRKPLPEVLKASIMDPIGASDTWEWHGYRNSTVDIDGRPMQSVSGGGHWGGGLWISSRDQALFGSLMLNRGWWDGRELLPAAWIDALSTPSPCNPNYGYMWWLNPNQSRFAHAPETSIFALGAGYNAVWVDPDHDLVMVVRWIQQDKLDALIGHVVNSLQ